MHEPLHLVPEEAQAARLLRLSRRLLQHRRCSNRQPIPDRPEDPRAWAAESFSCSNEGLAFGAWRPS